MAHHPWRPLWGRWLSPDNFDREGTFHADMH